MSCLSLRFLVWKNFTIRWRSKLRTTAEIIWPLTLFIILALVRTRGLKEYQGECFVREKALPSAGYLKFLQTLTCTPFNWCYNEAPPPLPFDPDLEYSTIVGLINELTGFTPRIGNLSDTGLDTFPCHPNVSNSILIETLTPDIHDLDLISAIFEKMTSTQLGQIAKHFSSGRGNENLSSLDPIFTTVCGFNPLPSDYFTEGGRSITVPRRNDFIPWRNLRRLTIDTTAHESDLTDKCDEFFTGLQNKFTIPYLFEIAYPFVRGKLVYAPNTTAFNRLVGKVNETFQDARQIESASQLWTNTVSPALKTFLNRLDEIVVNITVIIGDTELPENVVEILANASATLKRIEETVAVIDSVANFTTSLMSCYEFDKFEGYPTEEEAIARGSQLLSRDLLWAVIVFEDDDSLGNNTAMLPAHIQYKIRMDQFKVDSTKRIKDYVETPLPRNDARIGVTKYFTSGFIFLQDRIDRAIIELQSNKTQIPGIYMQQMPGPCLMFDHFQFVVGPSFPLFMNLAFVFSCAMIVKSIVFEKERRLKETMRIMGLGNGVHWTAWFVDSMSILLLVCIALPIVLYYGNVLEKSDPFVVFVFLLSFCTANVCFSFLISTLFDRANLAAACGAFIYFVSYQPYFLIELANHNQSLLVNILLSLVLNVGFAIGNQYIVRFEEKGVGAQWSNMATSPVEGDPYSLLGCILMMLLDAFVYLAMALYIEAVFPGEFGVPRPWHFVFDWRSNKRMSDTVSPPTAPTLVYPFMINMPESDLVESETNNLPVGVRLRNLGKTYSNGKEALRNLNLDFYDGQITAFLGHNGAGKTTTISILTGLYPPTTGTATIHGLDIRYQMNAIRRQLGICPQYNVLFDNLTVEEHLRLYANLKTGEVLKSSQEIDQMIEDLGLTPKRKELSCHLSGGMKRILSIGSAFIGNSKTVILDEPTAGVDPHARRLIWDILLKYKKGRTIILTTHFMDEADVLGDRIAIISQGELKCCGSSMFLKRQFGSGYYLTLVRKSPEESSSNRGRSNNVAPPPNDLNENIQKLISQYVPNNFTVHDAEPDLVICLPEFDEGGESQREQLPRLLGKIESDSTLLGIDSYGVSDTTLEEIFLKVVGDPSEEGADVNLETEQDFPYDGFDVTPTSSTWNLMASKILTGAALIRQQIKALYVKRFRHQKRNWKGFFCEIILPAVLIVICEIFSLSLNFKAPQPPLVLTPWLYGESTVGFYALRNSSNTDSMQYISAMLNQTGMGVRCTPDNPTGLKCSNERLGLLNPDSNPLDYQQFQCPCELGVAICPSNVSGGELWKYGSVTTDEFYDLSGNDVGLWIIRTYKDLKKLRFGGFEFGVHDSTSVASVDNVRVWFENKMWASSVSYLNAVNNVILRSSLPLADIDATRYGITTINHPLEYSSKQPPNTDQLNESVAFAITVIFAMSFVPASFVLFLVEERVSKMKHLQFVSGVKPVTFWVATYTWDLANYIVPCFVIISIFLAFGQSEYVAASNIGGMILLLVFFGLSAIPLMYPTSLVFSAPSTAFVSLACANLFIGTVTTISSFVLQLFDDPQLRLIGSILNQVFLIFPHFCLGRGMMDLAQEYYYTKNLQLIGYPYQTRNIFEWGYLGRYFGSMTAQAIVFFGYNLLLYSQILPESRKRCFKKVDPPPSEREDDDVHRERIRVEGDAHSTDELRLMGLTKVYGSRKTPATDRLTFGLQKGECFGLLGVNGAGKSTTFKMLTGDEVVTRGDAFVSRYSVVSHLGRAQQKTGYCPQEDALLRLLTGAEHLELFARLRGIPDCHIKRVVDGTLHKMNLLPYRDRNTGTFSGGNKRKLCTAIALIGSPAVVLLDEPSSGMDPRARRSLWQLVTETVKESSTVLLTSHLMEECQAVCTRLAVMVNGTLRCLGSPQHLKNKFGNGYMIRAHRAVGSVDDLLNSVQSAIPEARLRESRSRQLVWAVPLNVRPVSELFHKMEEIRTQLSTVDYSITQTTLDDVFLHFVRLQVDTARSTRDDAALHNRRRLIPISESSYVTERTDGLFRGTVAEAG